MPWGFTSESCKLKGLVPFFLFLTHAPASVQFIPASWQGEVAGLFETNKAAPDGGSNRLLFEILRIFPSAECIEALRSVCRKAVARAIDSTGLHLHKVGTVCSFNDGGTFTYRMYQFEAFYALRRG